MVKIQRLRAMAREAIMEYQSTLVAGGEPSYPQWAEDLLEVCDHAEVGLQFRNVVITPVLAQEQRRHVA